jgi:hypothetical protein
MSNGGVVISNGLIALALHPNGGLDLLQIPSLNDDSIHNLLEIFNRLPDGFGLLLNRHSGHIKILHIADGNIHEPRKLGTVEDSALQNMPDDFGSKTLEAEENVGRLHSGLSPSGEGLLIAQWIGHRFR